MKGRISMREALRSTRPETVDIRLPIDRKQGANLLVSVNGMRYSIERGRTVTVPYAVAEVIEQSAQSDQKVQERIAALTESAIVVSG